VRGTNQMKVSVQLSEAIKLYTFVDRDIWALGQGESIDPSKLTLKRRALSMRIAELASLIDAEQGLAEDPALAVHMFRLFNDLRGSLARHQEKWSPTDAAGNTEAYLASAQEVRERSAVFRQWCETNLD